MMSLDFLVGFTVFLLALIMVVSMVPGLLMGLESSGIDYDAVAYRTGVILVEDPGWGVPPSLDKLAEDERKLSQAWEVLEKSDVQRIGLAASGERPNILLSTKIEMFFSDSFFDEGDRQSKLIFGDYPYSYNISLRSLNGTYDNKTGAPLPPGYGYIRRVVKIAEPAAMEIDAGECLNSEEQAFIVQLNLNQLRSDATDPIYRIDPRVEPVNVTITNCGSASDEGGMILKSIRFQSAGGFSIPFDYGAEDPDRYTLYIDGDPHNLTPDAPVSEEISFVLKPVDFSLESSGILNINFTFANTAIAGTYCYDYENITRPDLKTAVLEVAIW